jgi:branched-chain amino acid transport system permease protein
MSRLRAVPSAVRQKLRPLPAAVLSLRQKRFGEYLPAVIAVVAVTLFPIFRPPLDGLMDDAILALAFVVMALGLNIVVGFAGLLDLGYVAFYAFGSLMGGWLASDHFSKINEGKGVFVYVNDFVKETSPQGIHLNFLLIVIAAIAITATAGAIIGLPTLRLRGDYIAIVTLAFGEIIGRFVANGDSVKIGGYALSNGRQSISPLDQLDLPLVPEFDSATNLRPYYWCVLAMILVVLFVNFRLRDSRLGRAWVALREDEVAAVSMGVPLVRVKLMAYAVGAAFGGIAGAFLGVYVNALNGNTFQFGVSIVILAMVILGGLGSIWGVVIGAVLLSFVNTRLIPDVLSGEGFQSFLGGLGLDFTFSEVAFGIFGFILLVMMVLRPEGLLPERRRKLELAEGVGAEESVFEGRS